MIFDYIQDEVILHRNFEPFRYDETYFDRYANRSQTVMGHRLTLFRRAYVECFTNAEDAILDYGSGYGNLVVEDTTGRWFGYDIMPESRKRLGDRLDCEISKYNAVCFFDVLEHFPNPIDILGKIKLGAKVFVSMPLWSGWNDVFNIVHWRHWRPNEHLMYASFDGLLSLMQANGFVKLDNNMIESSLGRLDIHTFCFHKQGR